MKEMLLPIVMSNLHVKESFRLKYFVLSVFTCGEKRQCFWLDNVRLDAIEPFNVLDQLKARSLKCFSPGVTPTEMLREVPSARGNLNFRVFV